MITAACSLSFYRRFPRPHLTSLLLLHPIPRQQGLQLIHRPLHSGPSRISEHEQLLILSVGRSRRSRNYAQNDRDFIVSSQSFNSGSLCLQVGFFDHSTTTTTTTPSPFQYTRMPVPLSDISDSDTEAVKTTISLTVSVPSTCVMFMLMNSPTFSKCSSYPTKLRLCSSGGAFVRFDIPPATNRASCLPSLSLSRHSNYPLHSPRRSLSRSYGPTHASARSSSTVTAVPGPQSQSHKHSLLDIMMGEIVVTKTTTITFSPAITTPTPNHTGKRPRDPGRVVFQQTKLSRHQYFHNSTTPIPTRTMPRYRHYSMPRPALSLSRSRSAADADPKARSTSGPKSRVPPRQKGRFSLHHC